MPVGAGNDARRSNTSRQNSDGKARAAGGCRLPWAPLAALAVAVRTGLGVAARARPARACHRRGGTPVARASSDPSSRPRWVIPGFAALCLLAFAIPIAVVAASRDSNASAGTSTAAVVTPPPFSWPAGAQLAPAFSLRDQHDQPVSVSAFRGHPVIVTFVDPLCRNLCPLEAHVLNAAVAELPVAQRPTILAVSVDVYANKRADLLLDVRKWSLVPQWHWAVGSRAALAAVWKRYKVGVSVVTKHVAGNTINYITHSEAAYVIDSSGHERALFLWPFYPQDVVRPCAESADTTSARRRSSRSGLVVRKTFLWVNLSSLLAAFIAASVKNVGSRRPRRGVELDERPSGWLESDGRDRCCEADGRAARGPVPVRCHARTLAGAASVRSASVGRRAGRHVATGASTEPRTDEMLRSAFDLAPDGMSVSGSRWSLARDQRVLLPHARVRAR